jgi:hypothetical protein
VSGSPLVEALTAADGSYTLSSANMPNPATIVIQAGKWRRQYPNTALKIGGTTTLNMAMPASSSTAATTTDGTISDLPHIAVVTGSADAIECIFSQIGINATKEITDPTGTGSINLYAGYQSTGEVVSASSPKELDLMSNPTLLQSYDLVMFGCQGSAMDGLITSDTNLGSGGVLENLLAYANNGGRVFTTHFEYIWLDNTKTFQGTANWVSDKGTITESGFPSGDGVATIDQSYAGGKTLASWLQGIGASYNNNLGQVELTNMRQDEDGAINPPAQNWATANNITGSPSMQFTFDTPIGAPGIPTVAIAYSGSSTQFLLGDAADTVTVDITNNSSANTDNTLTLAITLPSGLSASSAVDSSGGAWVCVAGTPTTSCSRSTPLYAGTADNVTLVFSIGTTVTPGQATITSTLSGGGLSNSNQCGRVLYNDYHVESPKSGFKYYPSACPSQTSLTNTQKFLEYSLYNLSNFVAPTTSDIIMIQSATMTTVTNIVSPIYYGQVIAQTAVEAAAGDYGAVDGGNLNFLIDGTIVCTLPATSTGACPPPAGNTYPGLYNAGTHTIQSVYVGDANYLTSSSPIYNVVVQPDPTTTTAVSSLNPSTTRQPVTFTATLTDAYAPQVVGTVAFLDGGVQIGTGTVANNAASFTVPVLTPGIHNITACLVQSTDYLASCSQAIGQIVTLPVVPSPTVTLLTSNVNPSVVAQAVTFSASVATTGAFTSIPTGPVTFLDGGVTIGSGTLNAAGTATYTTTSLAAGTHMITASYAGTTTVSASVSAAYTQVVNVALVTGPSEFLMTVAPTTLSVGVGAGVSVSVNILELNNFNQPVQLACTNLPSEMGCTFAQSLIPASGGTTQLIISPAAPHDCNASTPYFVAGGGNGWTVPMLGLTALGLFAARRRKRLMQGIALAAALCVLPMLNGCGSGNCTDFGVKPGNYTFTVTGTSTGSPVMTQTQVMTLTVHI